MERINFTKRLLIIISIALLHSFSYYSVNIINSNRPSSDFYNFHIIIDSQIPYIGWTWVFYYFGDIYIIIWATMVVLKLQDRQFLQAVYVYSGMIISGAVIQLILPGVAPWPNDSIEPQQLAHSLIFMRPYACLPSMHVALTVLPACILYSVFKSIWIRVFSTLTAVLITISTLTLKEHYFLDAVTGVLLAFIYYGIWRLNFKNLIRRTKKGKNHGHTER